MLGAGSRSAARRERHSRRLAVAMRGWPACASTTACLTICICVCMRGCVRVHAAYVDMALNVCACIRACCARARVCAIWVNALHPTLRARCVRCGVRGVRGVLILSCCCS